MLRNKSYQDQTKANKMAVISRIKEIVKNSFEDSKISVQIQGSFVTGIETPGSDIDLQLTTQNPISILEQIELLERLQAPLRSSLQPEKIEFFPRARVPILKIQILIGQETKEIDFTFKNWHPDQFISTTEQTLIYLEQMPILQQNLVFLKLILQAHGLNKPYTGGLNSYALTILYVAYLKYHFDPKQNNVSSLLGFMKFYCKKFNPAESYIDLKSSGKQCVKEKLGRQDLVAQELVLLDPTIKGNVNVTNNS